MVQSLLDKEIKYPEIEGIDNEDQEYDAPAYEIMVDGIMIEIGLGKSKNAYIKNSIVYYPVYLLYKNKVVRQIGLYEILEDELPNVLDEEGDLDLTKINDILKFENIKKDFLLNYTSDISKTNELKEVKISNNEEEEEEEQEEGIKYDKSKSDNWVQVYFRNNNFDIVDNEGGGDCLFACIRDGLETIGKSMTVPEMRNRLSKEATPDLYQTYRNIYEQQYNSLKETELKIKSLLEESRELKNKAKTVTNREEKAELLKRAKEIASEHKEAKQEKEDIKELLDDYKWMAKIDSFPKFVKAIRTCSYWADTWAISVLERILNIKLIILSENAYEIEDVANIINCGEADEQLQKKGLFRPADYIIVTYTGSHYKLVTYNDKGAFNYNELPKEIINLVKEKCMERMAGLFALIPEFNQGLVIQEEQLEEPEDLSLYNDLTVFQFYEKSADKPLPGKGSGEKLGPEGDNVYKKLRGDWRKMLSRGYISPFKLDEHMWNSVEHYVQANKFKNEHPEYYRKFALDNDDELSKNPDMAKAFGMNKKYNNKVIRPKTIEIDRNWNNEYESEIIEKAQEAKFENENLKNILKLTGKAKLVHYNKGESPRIEIELMRVRNRV